MPNLYEKCVVGLGVAVLAACGSFAAPSVAAQSVRPLGPPGGDVQALTALPGGTRTLYFGTPDGHIFGSVDGGAQWSQLGRVGTGHDEVVTAIVVDPRSVQTLYAGSWSLNSSGGGVFRSDNGGREWRLIGLNGHAVRALVQAPSNPDVLIAGAVEGVFRSGDAGKTWDRISPEKHNDLRNFDSIAIDPRTADTIYAGTYHLPWKTTDGGRNWFTIHKGMVDDSDVMSISLDPRNPLHVFASACSGIYQSSDGGANWTKFKGIPSTSRRTVQIKQDPQHPEIVYAATTEGLWRTLDGGALWRPITPLNWSILSMVIDPVNPKRLVLGTERMGVKVSEDGGATYQTSNQGFSHRRIAELAMDATRPDHALVVLTNAIEPVLETRDGGRNWQPPAGAKKVAPLRSVFAAPNGWWGALLKGGLVHHNGTAWVPAVQVVETTVRPKVTAPVKSTAKATPKGKAAAPAVAAAKVVLTKSPIKAVVNDMAFGRDAWYAASESGVFVSRDSGATWVLIPAGAAGSMPARAVSVSAASSSAWAVAGRNLITSSDAGKSWSAQPLPFEPRGGVSLHVADASSFLLASDRGLYESRDGGQSWRQSSLPELLIEDMAVSGDAVLVSTRTGSLYVSRDEGRSWTRSATNVDTASFPSLRAISSPASGTHSSVLAASATEGLFVLDLGSRQSATLDRAASASSPSPVPARGIAYHRPIMI